MAESRLDTRHHQETPEGVTLTLTPAGPVSRALAWAFDLGIRAGIYTAAAVLLASLGGEAGAGLMLLGAFLLEWFYPVFFEVRRGTTPGKNALDLRVVMRDGSPPDLGASLLRNLVRFVDFLPVGYLLGLTSCVLSPRFQRLGDLAAGTLVVHAPKVQRSAVQVAGTPMPPPLPLTQPEQAAIVQFSQRSPQWSEARVAELASHSGPCTHGEAAARVRQLLGYARWIVGER